MFKDLPVDYPVHELTGESSNEYIYIESLTNGHSNKTNLTSTTNLMPHVFSYMIFYAVKLNKDDFDFVPSLIRLIYSSMYISDHGRVDNSKHEFQNS